MVGIECQLLTGHPGIKQDVGTGLVVTAQPERVIGSVSSSGPQRKMTIKAFTALLRMVKLDLEASQEVLLCLHRQRHVHCERITPDEKKKTADS